MEVERPAADGGYSSSRVAATRSHSTEGCGPGSSNGAVPTLWCTLRGMEKEQQCTIVQNFNLATLAVTMADYVATGAVTRDMLPLLPVVAIALLVPVLFGARVYVGLSEAAFRRLVLSLLSLSGLAMLASAVPELLG